MNLAERIKAAQTKRNELAEKLVAVAGDEAKVAEYDALKAEIATLDKSLANLKEAAELAGQSAAPVAVQGNGGNADSKPAAVSRIQMGDNPNVPKGLEFARVAIAKAIAQVDKINPAEYARKWDSETPRVRAALEGTLVKGAVAAGDTADSAWAGPLVQLMPLASEFVEFLYPATVMGRMAGFRNVPFNVKMPRQTSMGSTAWVGQNSPAPAGKLAFETVSLGFSKVRSITIVTKELLRFSNPQVDLIVRDDMQEAAAKFLDIAFLDPSKAAVTNVSPAAATYGAYTAHSSGSTIDDIIADVNKLVGEFTKNNVPLSGAYWVMNPRTAQAIGTLRTNLGVFMWPQINAEGGVFFGYPVITSNNCALGANTASQAYAVLIRPRELFMAKDGAVEIDITGEASVEMDSAPSGGATSLVSLYQNGLVGIAAEQYINWLNRRAHAVAVLDELAL